MMNAPLQGNAGGHTGTALPISIKFFHAAHTNKMRPLQNSSYILPFLNLFRTFIA